MDGSRPVATPMALKLDMWKLDEEDCDPTLYTLMIGSLIFMMTATRPDITDAIGNLSQYNHDRSNQHMIGLNQVFRYLNRVKEKQLHFGEAFG
jgi:hypothetical protein